MALVLCIIMLKHEMIAADECHDNGPQDFVALSLCIQIAIDKIKLCSLSISIACCCDVVLVHVNVTIAHRMIKGF